MSKNLPIPSPEIPTLLCPFKNLLIHARRQSQRQIWTARHCQISSKNGAAIPNPKWFCCNLQRMSHKKTSGYRKEWNYPKTCFVGYDGNTVFAKHIHCQTHSLPNAQHKKSLPPNKAHHALCPSNKRRKGMLKTMPMMHSACQIFATREKKSASCNLKCAAEKAKKTSDFMMLPVKHISHWSKPQACWNPICHRHWQKRGTHGERIASPAQESPPEKSVNAESPTKIRESLDKGMEEPNNGDNTWSWTTKLPFPPACAIAIAAVCAQLQHRKPKSTLEPLPTVQHVQQALEKCKSCFKPGTCARHFLPEPFNKHLQVGTTTPLLANPSFT